MGTDNNIKITVCNTASIRKKKRRPQKKTMCFLGC